MATGTRIDLHVKVLGDGILRRARAAGIDAIVYAPHFTRLPEIRRRAARFSTPRLPVIPAREVFTGTWRDRKHVLAIGLTDPVPDFVTLDGAIMEFVRQDAAILVPHPTFATVSLTLDDIQRYGDYLDAVEVYNPKHLPWHNRRAAAICRDMDLPVFASSYAHLPWTVGEVWTVFDDPIEGERDLVDALTSREPRQIGVRRGVSPMAHRLAELGHLLYENSWQKFERVVLSAREATHPTHPAYRGRFDDVRV